MKLSARNQLKGKIVALTKGPVRIDVGEVGHNASITNEAALELALRVDEDAYTVIKASDVMVAK